MSPTGESSPSVASLLGFHGRSILASWGGGDLLVDYAVREINALLWLFLIVVTAFLLQRIVALLRLWDKGRRIPGPPCPSFFGHSKLISASGSGNNLNGTSIEILIIYLAFWVCFFCGWEEGVMGNTPSKHEGVFAPFRLDLYFVSISFKLHSFVDCRGKNSLVEVFYDNYKLYKFWCSFNK